MAALNDSDFYVELAIRCFDEAKRIGPSLAADGMGELGQYYLRADPGSS